jgi:hypothetical protein
VKTNGDFRCCTLLLFIAFLIRAVALLLMLDGLRQDPDGYGRLAVNLVERHTFGDEKLSPLSLEEDQGEVVPTAYRPPLYPLVLTGCVALGDYGLKAVGMLHVLLGVATVGMTFALGQWWGLGRRGAAVAALLVACDPILLASSSLVMTETLATFLATAGLLVLTWAGRERGEADASPAAKQMLAGATLALAALCRPAFLLWTIAAGIVLWWSGRKDRLRTSSRAAAFLRSFPWAFILGALIVLSPWAVRNQREFGRPIVTTTHGGYTLLLANNPEFYQWLREGAWGSVWQADQFNADWESRRPSDELQADRQAYSEAWQTIAHEPSMFAYSCLVRIGRFWSPLPHQTAVDESTLRRLSRYAVAAWYLVEYLCVAIGVWRMARRMKGEGRGEKGEAANDLADHDDALTLTLSQRERGPALLSRERGQESASAVPPSPLALRPSPLPLRSPTWLWGLLLVACLMAGHTIYWTDMRMRAPLMPVVALAAAWAFAAIASQNSDQ